MFLNFQNPIETAELPDTSALQAGPGMLGSFSPSHGVDRGSLLGVSTAAGSPPGGLFAVGMLNFDELTEFAPAAGVRGWRLRISPGFSPAPHLAFSAFVNLAGKNLLPGCEIVKTTSVDRGRACIDVYLVDPTNAEVDPANVLGIAPGPNGPNLVSIGVALGGNLYRP